MVLSQEIKKINRTAEEINAIERHPLSLEIFENKHSQIETKIGKRTLLLGDLNDLGEFEGQHVKYDIQGNKQAELSYAKDYLQGKSIFYYTSGKTKCEIEFVRGKPTGEWRSYTPRGKILAKIFWNTNSLPTKVELFYPNGLISLERQFIYDRDTCLIKSVSFYKNSNKFEEYSTEIPSEELMDLIKTDGLLTILSSESPKCGLSASQTGLFTGFYTRYYKNGNVWLSLEFDHGLLEDIFESNDRWGNKREVKFRNGTGELSLHHYYGDVAITAKYAHGLLHGSFISKYEGGNKHIIGTHKNGLKTGQWLEYSFSGKRTKELNFNSDTLKTTLFSANDQKSKEFTTISGLLNETSYSFDFLGDTLEIINYKNGLHHGDYKKFINGILLRSGTYYIGEPVNNWITHGQFNDISHNTIYGDKSVKFNASDIPRFNSNITYEVTSSFEFKTSIIPTASYNYLIYPASEIEMGSYLLSNLDSDIILGASLYKVNINYDGWLNDIIHIKSPDTDFEKSAKNFIQNGSYFSPSFILGFPSTNTSYLIIDHYRN